MDEKTAWEKFLQNGRVADYLKYKSVVAAREGEKREPVDKRPDYKG